MYSVYVLRSGKSGRHYIGSAADVAVRLAKHNSGAVRSTKAGLPWEVIHTESFGNRTEAVRREREIKSYKGGNGFRKLIIPGQRGEVA